MISSLSSMFWFRIFLSRFLPHFFFFFSNLSNVINIVLSAIDTEFSQVENSDVIGRC